MRVAVDLGLVKDVQCQAVPSLISAPRHPSRWPIMNGADHRSSEQQGFPVKALAIYRDGRRQQHDEKAATASSGARPATPAIAMAKLLAMKARLLADKRDP